MIVFFVDHLVVAVFRGVKTAGDPHPSGPVSAPVFSRARLSACRRRSCSDIMVGRAACAFAMHTFLLCLEHDNGWVRWSTLHNAHTNKHFKISCIEYSA